MCKPGMEEKVINEASLSVSLGWKKKDDEVSLSVIKLRMEDTNY